MVPPAQATSIQFHAEVKVSSLRAMLRRSGHNKLYITPKDETGKASAAWRVIWLTIPREAIEVRSAGFPASAGLVKGKQRLGLRVESKHFVELWNHFYPGQEPPSNPMGGQLWKVHPVPCGVDKTVLKEWAAQYKWDINPTRPLGQRAWLFTAMEPPESKPMYFNGTPVILKKLESPGNMEPIGLIAGPRSKVAKEQPQPLTGDKNAFRLGDPHFDPWKQASQASDSVKSMPTGPTATQLDQHERQLQALEQVVTQIKQTQTEQANATSERFQALENNVAKHHGETQQAFQALQHDFERTLTRALSDQDSRISSQQSQMMNELKQLLLRNDKRKAEATDDDM